MIQSIFSILGLLVGFFLILFSKELAEMQEDLSSIFSKLSKKDQYRREKTLFIVAGIMLSILSVLDLSGNPSLNLINEQALPYIGTFALMSGLLFIIYYYEIGNYLSSLFSFSINVMRTVVLFLGILISLPAYLLVLGFIK